MSSSSSLNELDPLFCGVHIAMVANRASVVVWKPTPRYHLGQLEQEVLVHTGFQIPLLQIAPEGTPHKLRASKNWDRIPENIFHP